MNDKELITAVRERLDGVHSETPLQTIATRGRRLRARRRVLGASAALAVLCGLGFAASTLVPNGGGQQLAAWSVATQRNGLVVVEIHQLSNPAGLQRRLRAAGVPATVRFQNQNPPNCLYYPGTPRQIFRLTNRIFPQSNSVHIQNGAAFVINTLAIPPGVGLWIEVSAPQTSSAGNGLSAVSFSTGEALVYASGRCPPT